MNRKVSLRYGFPAVLVALWILPIVIIVIISGTILTINIRETGRNELELLANGALEQTEMRIYALLDESKAVSYDGEVTRAYRQYLTDDDAAALYKSSAEYLNRAFLRDENVKAVFISFRDCGGISPYVVNREGISYKILKQFRDHAEDTIISFMNEADTGIYFLEIDGELYLVRNLLDSRFSPYATVSMLCDSSALFQAFRLIDPENDLFVSIDGPDYSLSPDGTLARIDPADIGSDYIRFSSEIDGHSLSYLSKADALTVSDVMKSVKGAVMIMAVLVVVLLSVMLSLLFRHVLNPVKTLADATEKVQAGQRGYIISDEAENEEFARLYSHFNSMSEDLKSQFERLYQEQQELQQAKIKALQSQINPHFLNNTLETINWEVRLAGNERASAMIDALSTMLDATLARDGRSMVTLREEMEYVDAYLYIINERLGGRLAETVNISEELQDILIPRLILQPIVENAVEHDISRNKGGRIFIEASLEGQTLFLDVIHDGTLNEEDIEAIRNLLSDDSKTRGSVGIRNVYQRLRLIYGDAASLSVTQQGGSAVLARIMFPVSDLTI